MAKVFSRVMCDRKIDYLNQSLGGNYSTLANGDTTRNTGDAAFFKRGSVGWISIGEIPRGVISQMSYKQLGNLAEQIRFWAVTNEHFGWDRQNKCLCPN